MLVIVTSLVVQWLGLHLPVQGVQVQSLVRKLGSPMPHGRKTKTENINNVVTNSVETLKMAHIKTDSLEKNVSYCYFPEYGLYLYLGEPPKLPTESTVCIRPSCVRDTRPFFPSMLQCSLLSQHKGIKLSTKK